MSIDARGTRGSRPVGAGWESSSLTFDGLGGVRDMDQQHYVRMWRARSGTQSRTALALLWITSLSATAAHASRASAPSAEPSGCAARPSWIESGSTPEEGGNPF